MMKKNGLTYEDFIALAKKHYNAGGDGVVECWDKSVFDTYVSMFGPITKRVAMSIIKA